MQPKVSVILTSFNHEKYIREAIDSVLEQTFTNFELIIWDDASSDNSWKIINSYSDPRVKTFRNDKTRRGIYGFNKAITEVASGEYIAIQHSDDVWKPEKLKEQVTYLDAHDEIGAVFTWAQIIDEKGIELTGNWFVQENKSQWQWLNHLFNGENHLCHPSVLIRKQCYEEVGKYRYGLAQTGDAEMWSRVLIRYPIHIIEEKLTLHRLFTDNSNTSSYSIETVIRANNEWIALRENYLSINDFENIISIFPNLERFRNHKGYDRKFLLAMACLYECKQKNAWQIGLKWLFDLINEANRYKRINNLYSFTYLDLIRLTGDFDVYDNRLKVERDGQIANLNRALAESDGQIAGLNQALAERDGQIAGLNQALAERDGQIAGLNQALAERDGQIAGLNRTIAILNADYKSIITSTSWRVTKPLRSIGHQLKRTVGFFKL